MAATSACGDGDCYTPRPLCAQPSSMCAGGRTQPLLCQFGRPYTWAFVYSVTFPGGLYCSVLTPILLVAVHTYNMYHVPYVPSCILRQHYTIPPDSFVFKPLLTMWENSLCAFWVYCAQPTLHRREELCGMFEPDAPAPPRTGCGTEIKPIRWEPPSIGGWWEVFW